MSNNTMNDIVHIGRIQKDRKVTYLYLRRIEEHLYRWYGEEETDVEGGSVADAIHQARKRWSRDCHFRTILCGKRMTLPERDEHGDHALFCQMAASLSSFNGHYYDEELGHTCLVQNPSHEARELWRRLKNER